MLDLVTNLSRRPGTAPTAISRKTRPAILHHSQTRKFIVEPGLDSFGAVKASRPEEANDVGAADDDHHMPIARTSGYACLSTYYVVTRTPNSR